MAARCLAAAGYGPGVCHDPRPDAATELAAELAGRRSRAEAAAQDIVVTCTPGSEPVVSAADLRSGQHLAVLGADGQGKAELEPAAISRCRLFCDEWKQASTGGERPRPSPGARWTGTQSGSWGPCCWDRRRAPQPRGDHPL